MFYVHLIVQKKDLYGEYIRYDNKNASAYNFMFLGRSGSNNVFHICPAASHLHLAFN